MTTVDDPTDEAAIDDRRVLTFERTFGAPRHRVFDAWVEPDLLGGWFFTSENGEPADVTVEPHSGGSYSVTDSRHEDDVAAGPGSVTYGGEYLEVTGPQRLRFTFAPEHMPGDADLVTAEFDAADTGTRLTVTVEGRSWPDGAVERFREQSERGWNRSLDRLAALPTLDG